MIKIPEQIWYVMGVGRADDLSYMCPYETKADGDPLANTVKMLETGRSWAKGWRSKEGPAVEKIEPNVPTTGIYIGSSVERYSTSNKLFRVKDPRGFTVEVPTDNIATLLHNSTVVNGYIQEPCVWARDGGHILLPVNSTPYREANKAADQLKNDLISVSSLNPGDKVEFFEDQDKNLGQYVENQERTFLGRVKLTYEVQWVLTEHRSYGSNVVTKHEIETIKDDKWVAVFDMVTEYKHGASHQTLKEVLSPKIVTVVPGNMTARVPELKEFSAGRGYGLPERVSKRLKDRGDRKMARWGSGWSLDVKVVDAEWKA